MHTANIPPHFELRAVNELLTTNRIGRVSGWPNEVWDTIASTNDRAVELAALGAPEGVIVLAREQTAGRGRHGRKWSSPADAGIHMSCVMRPKLPEYKLPVYTLAVGVACARAIHFSTGVQIGLKWVNDLVYGGKKVGGILCEMPSAGKTHPDGHKIEPACIVGVGVNVHSVATALPAELIGKVEWLERATGQPVNLNVLAAQIAAELESISDAMAEDQADELLNEWRNYSVTLDQNIVAVSGNHTIKGWTQDIDSEGALLVRTTSGEIVRLQAGEISIRLADGSYV